jgi:hypothetical protein
MGIQREGNGDPGGRKYIHPWPWARSAAIALIYTYFLSVYTLCLYSLSILSACTPRIHFLPVMPMRTTRLVKVVELVLA